MVEEYAEKQYKSHIYVIMFYHTDASLIRQLHSVKIPVSSYLKFGCVPQKFLIYI
jgi:hypothetical protein